jgi:SNF2 family DNA or RNA helicase
MESGLKIEAFIYDKLRPHQIEGVNFMYECITGKRGNTIEGCILADFMGLGKTLQTLTLIRCAIIHKIAQKIVVVSPLTLVKVWEKECAKWMGNKLSPLVTLGNPEEIEKTIRMFVDYDYRLLFTSY